MFNRKPLIIAVIVFVLTVIVIGLQSLAVAAETPANRTVTTNVVPLGSVLDTSLYEENGLRSNGKGEYFFAGATQGGDLRRGLVKFDIASNVPPNTIIVSATLRLHVSKHPLEHKPESFTLHRITTEWGEGDSDPIGPEGSGATATEGDATWTFSYFSPTPTERINWTNPGGDFLPAVSASTVIDLENEYYTWGPSREMLADLRYWQRNPTENYGWIVLGNESENWTARRFDSRENSVAANRPVLTVEYVQGYPSYLPLIIGQ